MTYTEFDAHERPSDGAERANYGRFLTNFYDLLDVPHPNATTAPPRPTELAHQMQAGRAVVAQAAAPVTATLVAARSRPHPRRGNRCWLPLRTCPSCATSSRKIPTPLKPRA